LGIELGGGGGGLTERLLVRPCLLRIHGGACRLVECELDRAGRLVALRVSYLHQPLAERVVRRVLERHVGELI